MFAEFAFAGDSVGETVGEGESFGVGVGVFALAFAFAFALVARLLLTLKLKLLSIIVLTFVFWFDRLLFVFVAVPRSWISAQKTMPAAPRMMTVPRNVSTTTLNVFDLGGA